MTVYHRCPFYVLLVLLLITTFATRLYSASTMPNEAVFNWVEYKFADLFPRSATVKSELTHEGIHYDLRSWSGAWGTRYLGITDDGEIVGLGDYTENELKSFGYIDDWEDSINADNDNVYRFDINEALQTAILSDAGSWIPKPESETVGNGQLGLYSRSLIKIKDDEKYSVALIGWSYAGWDPDYDIPPTVNMALFKSNEDGTLNIDAGTYINDTITNGGANIIVADFNGDGHSDMLMPAHNESPFVGRNSIAYLSNEYGTFDKITLDDSIMAHGTTLTYLEGDPVVYTGTYGDALQSPIYKYENGQFVVSELTNLSAIDGCDSEILFDRIDNKKYLVRSEISTAWDGKRFASVNIGFFEMNGYDAATVDPAQEVVPYLSTLDEFQNFNVYGQSHVFKVFGDDVNHDGRDDLIALNAMWTQETEIYPTSIDIVLASENGFYNATEQLCSNIPNNVELLDHSPIVIDIDNSGIETYFLWDSGWIQGSTSVYDHVRQGNYALLNDGTGKLHVGLHDEFFNMAEDVLNFENTDNTDMFPKFVAIPQPDGSVNFLATRQTGYPDVNYTFTNIPIHWNPTIHFNKDITISDRNNSMLMRTWAGNDVFYDTNANSPAHINGGFGINKCVYSGNSSKYAIVRNEDGSHSVIKSDNSINDTLVNIQVLVFSDIEIDLQ